MSVLLKDLIFLVLIPLLVAIIIAFIIVLIDRHRFRKLSRSKKIEDRIKLVSSQSSFRK